MAFSFTTRPRSEWFFPDAINERLEAFGGWISGSAGGGGYRIPTPQPRDWSVISEVPQTWEELEAVHPEVFEPILETRPGLPPDPYPQPVETVTEAQSDEDENMAHDWGHFARQVGGSLLGLNDPGDHNGAALAPPVGTGTVLQLPPVSTGEHCDGMVWSGGTPPKGYKVVNYCGRGVLRKVRRRRRRRMLTASDASDLATIVGIVGKGQMASSMINRTRS